MTYFDELRDELRARVQLIGAALSTTVGEIAREQQRQFEKWGDQSHVSFDFFGNQTYVDYADLYKGYNDEIADLGLTPQWSYILLEEVYEALSETDPHKQIEELTQVAAVCATKIDILKKRIADDAV